MNSQFTKMGSKWTLNTFNTFAFILYLLLYLSYSMQMCSGIQNLNFSIFHRFSKTYLYLVLYFESI